MPPGYQGAWRTHPGALRRYFNSKISFSFAFDTAST